MRPWGLTLFLVLCASQAWPTAYFFSGTATPRVSTTSNPTGSNTSTFSVGCWTYRQGDGFGGLGRVMQVSDVPSARGWMFFWDGTNYLVQFGSTGTDPQWRLTSPVPALNTWAHLWLTVDLSSDINTPPTLYVNGVAGTVSANVVGTGSHGVTALTDSLIVGNRNSADRGWHGALASCAWYDRVLSAGEVRQVMHCGPQTIRRGLLWYGPLGAFGGRDYSATPHTTLTPTNVAVTRGPPVSCAQGGWFND